MSASNSATDRRTVLRAGAGLAAAAATFAAPSIVRGQAKKHELPKLPYEDTALAPVISKETIEFHYGKHHMGYLNNLNNMLANLPDMAALSLEDLVKSSRANPNRVGLFNNAAQVWNHTFYWNSMSPKGGGEPTGKLKDKIGADFGGFDKFRAAFRQAALTQFASGWAWLIVDEKGKLGIRQTGNAETPLGTTTGVKPLLTIDVWEHAYYIDYRNERGKYIDAFLDKVVNWEFAAQNLG
jgi:superoxide dismutase, Fe-Mn family